MEEALSPGNVAQVLSRRMQASEKTLYPRHDDEVGKLIGVGKECASKLADLKAAGLSAPLINCRIETGTPAERHAAIAFSAVLSLALGEFWKLCPWV